MGRVKSKEMVCISHILGFLQSIAQLNIHTTLIQPRILIAVWAFLLLGRKKKPTKPRKGNSLQICNYISLHCLNPVLMQTTWFRHSSYTGMLSYCPGQEQPDTQGFLLALSTLLNIRPVRKLTLPHSCSHCECCRDKSTMWPSSPLWQQCLAIQLNTLPTPGAGKCPRTPEHCGKTLPTYLPVLPSLSALTGVWCIPSPHCNADTNAFPPASGRGLGIVILNLSSEWECLKCRWDGQINPFIAGRWFFCLIVKNHNTNLKYTKKWSTLSSTSKQNYQLCFTSWDKQYL